MTTKPPYHAATRLRVATHQCIIVANRGLPLSLQLPPHGKARHQASRTIPARCCAALGQLHRVLATVALSGVMLLASAPASAQTAEEKAGARAAANSGADAFEAGDFEKAADMFLRAESIIHSPVHELYLARSYAQLGRLVEAREMYLKLIRENDGDRAEVAQRELDALEPRVPRVTLNLISTDAPASEVTVDGRPLPVVLLGVAQPFDPGDHTVEVLAGNRRLTRAFSVEEGGTAIVELDMAEGELIASAEPAPTPIQPAPSSEPVPVPEKGVNGMRVVSYVALGAGAVGVGLGTAFAVRAGAKARDANDLCATIDARESTHDCAGRTRGEQGAVEELEQQHKSAKVVGIIGFATGGALLAAGVTLFLLSPESKSEAVGSKLRVHPTFGLSYLGLKGSF